MLFLYNVAILILIFFFPADGHTLVDKLNEMVGVDFHGFIFYIFGLIVVAIIDGISN